LLTNGIEQDELTEPRKALESAGAKVETVAPAKGEIQAMNHHEKGDKFPVGVELSQARPENYDALLLPGRVANPDYIRLEPRAGQFVRWLFDHDQPAAAICHGPWMLVEADVLRGRTLLDPDVPVITRDQVRFAKPDPDLFLRQRQLSGWISKARSVVGDSIWDLLAARRAQALGVGVLSGGYGQDELECAGAYRVYEDPADLLNHLDDVGVRISVAGSSH
jgi:putative intracellular protease/amidase